MSSMKQEQPTFFKALVSAIQMLYTIAPMLLAVIGMVGLFQTFITPEMLHSLFKGSTLYDTFVGTITGGISVGQPFLSYIIGGELLEEGISLYAVTSFILSFVSLGLIQLPLEYSLFGIRFTIVRNLLSFLFAILVSWATVITLEILS
ncbi:MAG: permease [Sulfurovum sp.]|nr:permease [Sulfurovum sp.]